MKNIEGNNNNNKAQLHTPLTILLPTLVTNPFRLSDRGEDTTKVEPGSLGASSATHSLNPSLKEASVSCSELSNQSSSCAFFVESCV